MRKIIIFLLAALVLAACKESSEKSTETTQRTVIVYMAAENNLDYEGYLINDINELEIGSNYVPSNDHLILFVDRSSYSSNPYIVEMKNGVCDTILTYQDDFYSSDPEHFFDVINTIQTKYPSKEYGLVLWGHATGWLVVSDTIPQTTTANRGMKAYGLDMGRGMSSGFGSKWMNITQMAKALNKLSHFKFIAADCCCMMCVEVAYELRHATDYLIGSPAEIPGAGAPYHLWIKDLFAKNDDFYRSLIDTYYDFYLELYKDDTDESYLKGYSVPLSVVDMRYIEDLALNTRALLQHPDSFKMNDVPFYFYPDSPIMYDMGELMKTICTPEEYKEWQKTLDKAVPYRRMSEHWMTAYYTLEKSMIENKLRFNENSFSGISMFVKNPIYNFSYFYDSNNNIPSMQWYTAVGWDRFD